MLSTSCFKAACNSIRRSACLGRMPKTCAMTILFSIHWISLTIYVRSCCDNKSSTMLSEIGGIFGLAAWDCSQWRNSYSWFVVVSMKTRVMEAGWWRQLACSQLLCQTRQPLSMFSLATIWKYIDWGGRHPIKWHCTCHHLNIYWLWGTSPSLSMVLCKSYVLYTCSWSHTTIYE